MLLAGMPLFTKASNVAYTMFGPPETIIVTFDRSLKSSRTASPTIPVRPLQLGAFSLAYDGYEIEVVKISCPKVARSAR